MHQAIQNFMSNKTLVNRNLVLHALAKQETFLAAISKQTYETSYHILEKLHFSTISNNSDTIDFLIQKDRHANQFLLGFSNRDSFKNWQNYYGSRVNEISLIPLTFNTLCILMEKLEKQETDLILDPHCANLIIANAVFKNNRHIITNNISNLVRNKSYIAMTPLEQGDFSSELLELLVEEFIEQGWIKTVWAATAQINEIESFLLIIEGQDYDYDSFDADKIQNLYQKLHQTCKAFLVGASLNIQNSKLSPFDAAILNYNPIFIKN